MNSMFRSQNMGLDRLITSISYRTRRFKAAFTNNQYSETKQPNFSYYLRSIILGIPKGLFPVGLPVKICEALLPPFILAT